MLAVRRLHAQRQQQQANSQLRNRMQDLSRNHYAVGARPLLPENHPGVFEHRSPRSIEKSRKAQERYLLLLSFLCVVILVLIVLIIIMVVGVVVIVVSKVPVGPLLLTST